MQRQSGFTLIELVVVIIVLGILAVTAAPKFIDLQSDARTATLKGVEGALKGANSMVYAKAAIAGIEDSANTTDSKEVDLGGGDKTAPTWGYVKADATELKKVLDLSGDEWTVIAEPGATGDSIPVVIHPKDMAVSASKKCWLKYEAATGSTSEKAPKYTVEADGC